MQQQGTRSRQRAEQAASLTARMLNANINPGFSTSALPMRRTESSSAYAYQAPMEGVDKERHLRKDAIKTYVEKALMLHDDRHGMPVVSSPIWAPAK